jgi:hypothetical protein
MQNVKSKIVGDHFKNVPDGTDTAFIFASQKKARRGEPFVMKPPSARSCYYSFVKKRYMAV